MATRDESLAALGIYYSHALGAYDYSDELIERMRCVIDTVAARVRAEAMSQAATRAVIHSMYPIENDFERGYNKGRKDAADDIRSLINKASEGAASKEKQG